ncbi:MAG: glycosyltransferase family 39 protein [Anaerolineae bacterium]|nr:glycosyltransferase family 39 protein [Anaerolineae bacterium]
MLASWALRLQRLDAQDIWWDEARNIDVATRPLAQIAGAPELDIHPPLYFYSLHAWTGLAGTTAFATRLFGVCCGVLAAVLTCRLARTLVPAAPGRWAGLLALALAAVSPYALAEAQETRMYTLSWVLLSAAALALWHATRPASHPWHGWLAFVILAAASVLTHYSTVLILAAFGVWLLGWALRGPDRLARLRTLGLAGLAMALLCLPALPIALRQIPGYHNPNLSLPALSTYLGQLYHAYTLGEVAPQAAWSLGRWLWLLLPLGGAVFALREPHRRRVVALLTFWLAGGLALYYLILTRRSAFNPRYISFVLPAFWALAGWALAGWRRLCRPLPWILVAGLALLSIPSLHADLTDPRYFHDDMRGVTAWLREHAAPGDLILVDQRYPFGFYWQRWNNDPYGFPPAGPAGQAPAQYLFVDINKVDERMTELAAGAETLFWVTWYESDIDPRGAVPALLDTHGRRMGEEAFRGYTVRWWQIDSPTRFRLFQSLAEVALRFEPGVTLLAADWHGRETAATAGRLALVTLRWQANGPTPRPLKVSLRLRDESGAALAQDDRLLLNDRHLRTPWWQPGETTLNVYTLPLPEGPGSYTLTLVLYDEETLQPVGLLDGSGVEPALGAVRAEPATESIGP